MVGVEMNCLSLLCFFPPLWRKNVFVCLFLFGFTSIAKAIIKIPGNKTIPAVFMFGDSIVDTGNNNYIKTIIRVNYPPYGDDFKGGMPTGRFSNGKVPSDLIVEELGLKELLPPVLDPSLKSKDLSSGVNFASGGAGFDPITSQMVSVLSLTDQLGMFSDYIEKLKGAVGEERTKYILENGVYMLVAGSNDISNNFYGIPFRDVHYNVDSYTNLMLNSASMFVQELYRMGGRRISVFSVPAIGCVPSLRTVGGGPVRQCADKFNKAAQTFNSKLSAELDSLNSKLPNARMVYFDIYPLFLDLIVNPTTYGFEISHVGCCGTGVIEVAYLCKNPCNDVSKYVFWDSFHPTENAYKILVHQLLTKYIHNMV